MKFSFGGVDFLCEGDHGYIKQTLKSLLPLDYVSFLAAQSYNSHDLRQQVLDALSPFQLVSKAWAVSVLRHEITDRYVYYPGSWLGQLAVAIHHKYKDDHSLKHVLIDKDPVCSEVARQAMSLYAPGMPCVMATDVFSTSLPEYQKRSLVMWTGLEHFDLNKVRDYVHYRPFASGTTFLFQGTDMPAPDHISPISSPDVILAALDIDPDSVYYKGSLLSHIGNRHQVVFTI